VADKIDRGILQGTEDLYNEIGKLEHLVGKNKYEKKSILHSDTKSKQTVEKKPYRICFNDKKGNRFHPEENCWLKAKNKKQFLKLLTLNWKLN